MTFICLGKPLHWEWEETVINYWIVCLISIGTFFKSNLIDIGEAVKNGEIKWSSPKTICIPTHPHTQNLFPQTSYIRGNKIFMTKVCSETHTLTDILFLCEQAVTPDCTVIFQSTICVYLESLGFIVRLLSSTHRSSVGLC